jgi:hypothetical protein
VVLLITIVFLIGWLMRTRATMGLEHHRVMSQQSARGFPPAWTVEQIPGGYKVLDANGQSLAYVYGRETKVDADIAEAWRIARNIARASFGVYLRRSVRSPDRQSLICPPCMKATEAACRSGSR